MARGVGAPMQRAAGTRGLGPKRNAPAPPADHDFRISRDDLLRYGNHSLTYRIVDRIFAQVGPGRAVGRVLVFQVVAGADGARSM